MLKIAHPRHEETTDEKEYLKAMMELYPEWIKERETELRTEYNEMVRPSVR